VIVCVAANPSIDKLFEVERLVAGGIHRPIGFVQTAGGKGLNVARSAQMSANVPARQVEPANVTVPRSAGVAIPQREQHATGTG
jgi:hypothetical protein